MEDKKPIIKPEDLSILAWIFENHVVSEKGEMLDFADRPFLIDILTDWSQDIVIKKCAQIGGSVSFNLKALYGIIKFGWNILYCVDEETELLSFDGWKKYNEIKVGEKILTLNPITGKSEYKPIKEIFLRDGIFDMVSMESRQFSALTTPNHRWLVNERTMNKVDKSKFVFKETSELKCGKTKLIPKAVGFDNKNKSDDSMAELLGWIFAEGYYPYPKNKKITRIQITQSQKHNPQYVVLIEYLLQSLAIPYKKYISRDGEMVNFMTKGVVSSEIRKRFPKKEPTSEWINSLSKSSLRAFITAMVRGDGCWTKGGYFRLIQKSKKTVDVFCHALVLLGIPFSVRRHKMGWYTVSEMNNSSIYADELTYKDKKYKGNIWCPRTENGTFMARRNGSVYWTGNTFPTDSDVQEFVSSKTNKIIAANPQVFAGMDTDNIERKELNGRFMFFKGTVSKTAAIMTTADLLIHDEASRSDQSVLDTMKSRTKASKYKGRWLFSNPTTEKDAIDIAWNQSDKKEWMITCHNPECQVEQTLSWPESIDKDKKIFQCKECKTKVFKADRRMGRWVAQAPGKSISGYHISLLMAPWVDAAEIIKDSEGDQEYFYNFVLGEPYSPGDIRVSRSTILDNWTPRNLETGNWYLGVDVGNIKHYVLGSELGPTKIGRFTKWADLDDMMKMYKPKLVIDAMPDNTMSKYYVENYRNALMSFFQENKNNPKTIVWWGEGDREGIVYSNRNRILDQLIDEILNAKILFGLSSDSEIKNYLKHWETLRRIKQVDNKGIESYCFIAGTKITTEYGDKNIEEIKEGDRVLTRDGFKRVHATMNRVTDVITKGNLRGTADHPVFTNKGVQPLLSIPLYDHIYTWQAKSLYTIVLSFIDTLCQKVAQIVIILDRPQHIGLWGLKGYIRKFTRIILEKSQRVLLFTIKTIIHLIIRQVTWSSYLQKNTTSTTLKSTPKTLRGQKIDLLKQKKNFFQDVMSGKKPQWLKSFLKNTGKITSLTKNPYPLFVRSVEKSAPLDTKEEENIVAKSVETNGITDNTTQKERVYNLTVEDTPEYFANGVLVHNCWDSTTGEDHYVFASLYYYLATLGGFGVGSYMPEALRGTDSKMLIGKDNIMGDLGAILAENNGWPAVE